MQWLTRRVWLRDLSYFLVGYYQIEWWTLSSMLYTSTYFLTSCTYFVCGIKMTAFVAAFTYLFSSPKNELLIKIISNRNWKYNSMPSFWIIFGRINLEYENELKSQCNAITTYNLYAATKLFRAIVLVILCINHINWYRSCVDSSKEGATIYWGFFY